MRAAQPNLAATPVQKMVHPDYKLRPSAGDVVRMVAEISRPDEQGALKKTKSEVRRIQATELAMSHSRVLCDTFTINL
jgi:hypothetical protein